MIPWDVVLPPVAGVVGCLVVGFLYAVWRDWRASRGLPAIRSGRRVAIPLTVDTGGDATRGRVIRDGEDLRIIAGGHHLVIDPHDFGRSPTRRGRLDDELAEYAELTGLVDGAGRPYYVGPPEEWAEAFRAALQAPAGQASLLSRLWAASSRKAVGAAVVALLLGGVFQAIWWSGHDVSARMVNVVASEDGDYCAVEWVDGGRRERAGLDCYEPYPAAGDPIRARALAWPFDESAMDYEGTFEAATIAGGALAALGLLAAGGVAVWRLRRPAIRLRPWVADAAGGPDGPRSAEAAEGMPFRELAAAVAEQEGWIRDAASAPALRWWQSPRMALGSARWWPVFVLAAVAWLPEGLPQELRWALSAGAGVALLWAVARAVGTFLAIRRPYTASVTSEWDYLLVRTVDDEWVALLLLGDRPHWAFFLVGDAHPPAAGRAGVRGDLEDGGAVHLRIADEYWVPASPVIRVDDEFLTDVREDLVFRLVGEDHEGAGAGAADRPNTVSP